MARTCSVCDHPQVDEINRELVGKTAVSEVAKRYNLSYDAVWRHRKYHIPQSLVIQIRKENELSLIDYLQELRDTLDQSKRIFEDARKKKFYTTALKALGEIRRILEVIDRIKEREYATQQEEKQATGLDDDGVDLSVLNEVEKMIYFELLRKLLRQRKEDVIPVSPDKQLKDLLDPNLFTGNGRTRRTRQS